MCDIQDMVWIMHTNHWAMEWAEANPDLQNRGGGGWSSRPREKGGPGSLGPSPKSATDEHPSTWKIWDGCPYVHLKASQRKWLSDAHKLLHYK